MSTRTNEEKSAQRELLQHAKEMREEAKDLGVPQATAVRNAKEAFGELAKNAESLLPAATTASGATAADKDAAITATRSALSAAEAMQQINPALAESSGASGAVAGLRQALTDIEATAVIAEPVAKVADEPSAQSGGADNEA